MTNDFERLCQAAYEGGRQHCVAYGGELSSIERVRAIVLAALRKIEAMKLENPVQYHDTDEVLKAMRSLIAQAEGEKR